MNIERMMEDFARDTLLGNIVWLLPNTSLVNVEVMDLYTGEITARYLRHDGEWLRCRLTTIEVQTVNEVKHLMKTLVLGITADREDTISITVCEDEEA